MTEPLTDTVPAAPAPAPRPSTGLLATLLVFVLAVAGAGYAWKGSPSLKPVPAAQSTAPDAEEEAARQQIEGMVGQLEQRLKTEPNNPTGWLMLGRAYSVLGRLDDAIAAYAKSLAQRPDDATTLTDYADVLASKNGGKPTAQTDELVARALALKPDHLKALALAGGSAFDRADYAAAVRYWEKLGQGLPANSPDAPRLQMSLAEARKRAGIAAPAATPVAAATASGAAATAAGPGVSGTVTLAPALAAQAAPNDTVFVFARAAQGPRMPLAVMRAQVKDLPITFKLDDSMAMAPTARISMAAQVIVGARVSKSGNPIAQPGDLTGESAPVAPGATGIAITISGAVGS